MQKSNVLLVVEENSSSVIYDSNKTLIQESIRPNQHLPQEYTKDYVNHIFIKCKYSRSSSFEFNINLEDLKSQINTLKIFC